ncbi:MAG: cellulose biosynthesis cyclic di-GMP-binding regulatory protein BcsB [Sphingomicrobium sp.]
MSRGIAVASLLLASAAAIPLAGQFGVAQQLPPAMQTVAATLPSNAAGADPVADATGVTEATISLAILGFRDGLSFDGLDGRSDLSFRVPPGQWAQAAKLVLPYKASAAVQATRTVTVMSRERVLGQFPISGDGTISLDLPLSAFVGDIATVTLIYSGGATPNRCFDRRVTADKLMFDSHGGLTLTPIPGQLPPAATVGLLVGNAPTVVLPQRPNAAQAAAALSVFAARGDSKLVMGAGPQDHVIQIGDAAQPALRVINPTALAVGGKDPAGAVRALFSGTGIIPTASTIDRLASTRPLPADLTLADLGANQSIVRVGHEYQWTIALPAARIPGGRSIAGMTADVATLPGDPSTRVSGWINDLMLQAGSPGKTGIVHLNLEAPPGVTNSMNWLTVRVDRNVEEGCDSPVYPMPAQLLASSKVILGAPEPGGDFHNFASAASGGVTVILQDAAALPFAARVAAAMLSPNVPVSVSFGEMPASGAVILVGDTPPAGLDAPMSLANGRMRIMERDGSASFDMPQATDDTIIEMLERDDGPVLWVRPAASGAVPTNMYLNQGNVAVVSPSGTMQAMATGRDRLKVATEFQQASWWDRNKGTIFLVGGLLLGSLLAAFALRPSRKRVKPGQDG